MSYAYRRRKKRIKEAKSHYQDGKIPPKHFAMLQAQWHREVTGPPLGTLEDFVRGLR